MRKPVLMNLILESGEVAKKYIRQSYSKENGFPLIDFSSLVPTEITVTPYAYLSGSCRPTDLALLKALASKHDVKDYFEIGTWRGESVANVASVVPNCYTFNLSEEELLSLDLPNEYVQLHGFFSKELQNVTHLFGNSHTFDFKDLYGKFDMIFVDGDHHYESVRKDTETAFKLIRDENSVIVWHDYAREPESIRWEVLAGILDGCPAEKRNKLYYVSNTLCAVYLNEKMDTNELQLYAKPDKYFSIALKQVRVKTTES